MTKQDIWGSEDDFPCDKCDTKFDTKDSLRKHLQDCDENKKLICTKCDYKTSKADLLHKHVENCKRNPQPKCAYCKFTT